MVGDWLPRMAAYMAQLLRDPEAVWVFGGKVSGVMRVQWAVFIRLMQIQTWCPPVPAGSVE